MSRGSRRRTPAIVQIFGAALEAWWEDDALRLGAALAYAEHRGTTFDSQVFAEHARRTQSGDTRNRLDVTQPTSANT